MMLNEIISITNSGDMLSGIGRAQTIKDGSFAGLGQFADDPEQPQKNFLSVLSQLGAGNVQLTTEASKTANLELAEGQLPDEVKADNAVSGKPKGKQGKQGKDGCDVKRIPSVYPETLALVMGFLSIQEPPQPVLSADPALQSPGLETEDPAASGLIADGSTPETTKAQCLPDECIILMGVPQVSPPGLPVSDLAKTAQIEVPALQKGNPDSVLISDSVVSTSPDLSQFLQGKLSQVVQGQLQSDPSKIAEPAQVFQGVEVPAIPEGNPDSVIISDSVLSTSPDLSQFLQGKLSQVLQGQLQSDPSKIAEPAQVVQGVKVPAIPEAKPDSISISGSVFSMSDAIHINPLTGKENTGAMGNQLPSNSVSFHQTDDAVEAGGTASPVVGTSNAGSIGMMDAVMSAISPERISDSDDGPRLQPVEPVSGDPVSNFVREGQMEKTSSENLSAKEIRHVNQSFHSEVLKQVVEKSAATLKSGQSEIRIDLKPESLGHLRLHVLMENQQVTVKILAENTQVKEMIERQASLIKNELQLQGIKVDAVNVDMLLSGGSDFASSHHEETAFQQARNAPAYGSTQEKPGESEFTEPDSPGQTNSKGGYLVNYFA